MRTTICFVATLGMIGCGGGDGSGGAGGTGGSGGSGHPVARFQAPVAAPVDVGNVPFPSDLYLDGNGKLTLGKLLGTANTQFDPAVHAAWASLDGWGVSTGVFFILTGGDVAPSSVSGTVHLYDLANGNEIPVEIAYNDRRHSIGAIPLGISLAESHAYGAVLVHPGVTADADFAAIRTLTAAPSDMRLAKAWTAVKPALDAAANKGIARDSVVAATAFHTQATVTPLEKLRTLLDGSVAPVGSVIHTYASAELDAYLGVPTTSEEGLDAPSNGANGTMYAAHHSHLGMVVHANLALKSFTGMTPSEIGLFQFDAGGNPQIRATYNVAFTVALPAIGAGCANYQNLPLVIFIPGVKHARSDMFAIADGFGAHCAAVASVDLPFHGSRTPMGSDTHNNVTGGVCSAAPCDYVGDATGLTPPIYFFNLGGGGPGIAGYDPRGLRDNFRQAAADVMQLMRTLTSGDLTTLRNATSHTELSFRPDVGIVAHSLGGYTTTLIAAIDSRLKVAVLDSSGGGMYVPTLTDAPWFGGQFVPILENGFGIMGEFSDGTREARFHPSLMFYQAVVDAADPMGLAPYVVHDRSHRGNTNVHLWLNSVHLDNTVPNQASEPLGAALGLTRVTLSTANPMLQFATMNSAPAPYTAASGPTAAFVRMATSTNNAMYGIGPSHSIIYWTRDDYQNSPPYPPFTSVTMFPVENPTAQYHRAIELFVMDFFAGSTPTVRDPYLQ